MKLKCWLLTLLIFNLLVANAQIDEREKLFRIASIDFADPYPGNGKRRLTSEKSMVAYVFLSPECPLCKNYAKVLNKIATEYADDLDVYGVVPGESYSNADVVKYIEKYKINFEVVKDARMELPKILSASVTPEVVLVKKNKGIVYRGAIDNWAISLGKQRFVTTQHYLEDAIRNSIIGLFVALPYVEPVGCLINDF